MSVSEGRLGGVGGEGRGEVKWIGVVWTDVEGMEGGLKKGGRIRKGFGTAWIGRVLKKKVVKK